MSKEIVGIERTGPAQAGVAVDETMAGIKRVSAGMLRRTILLHVLDSVSLLRIKKVKEYVGSDDDYVQEEPYRLHEYYTVADLRNEAEHRLDKLAVKYPDISGFREALRPIIHRVTELALDVGGLWDEYGKILDAIGAYLGTWSDEEGRCAIDLDDDNLYVHLDLRSPVGILARSRANDLNHSDYLSLVSRLIEDLRRWRRLPTRAELVAICVAYGYLSEGKRLDRPYRTWGTSGFRDYQTYMSVTDPGEGHLYGTTADTAKMQGVIVHVEHLERGSHQDREAIEPYRLPAYHTIAKVRLHVGYDAPCSSYVGRPVFEGDVQPSLLKTVHTMAAACSAIFMDGMAESKIAIERMTATEAVYFMRTIVGGVRRDRHTQYLAAAFNLNTPILDDRPETLEAHGGNPRLVTDRFEIGLLSIELVKAGGFDKVTWDGNANTYPSTCVLEQITREEALRLVHLAHEAGLLTYFSAGFRFQHLPAAVHTGVDGVGVGGAQILRYMDKRTGYHGPFKEENIDRILSIRDEAAREIQGRAAQLLCRLDRMYFEKSITAEANRGRETLFEQLKRRDVEALRRSLDELHHVADLPPDVDHPLVAWVDRLTAAGSRSIAAEAVSPLVWQRRLRRLARYAGNRDLDQLAEELREVREGTEDRRLSLGDDRGYRSPAA